MKNIFLSGLVLCLFLSCSNKIENVEKSFYYWKNDSWNLSDKENITMTALDIKKLYIKFFEVDHDEVYGDFPIAKTSIHIYPQEELNIVPTVYIKNEVFKNTNPKRMDSLADNIDFLITKYSKEKFNRAKPITEFQMDCDWTLTTRDNYFYFLKKLKEISKKKISCTLRLYPYKYPDKMGIPPVDKAVLMCYNLVSPFESQSKNSILDIDELKLYLNTKRKYPVHLDIALPIYSWMQVYQNNKFTKIIYNGHENILMSSKEIKPMWYEMTKDKVVDDFYLRVGDKIKYEKINADKINQAIEVIKKNVVFDSNTTVALFHLDEEQLRNYNNETLSGFYTAFSK